MLQGGELHVERNVECGVVRVGRVLLVAGFVSGCRLILVLCVLLVLCMLCVLMYVECIVNAF